MFPNHYIKEEDQKILRKIKTSLRCERRTNEFTIEGITKIKYYNVQFINEAVDILHANFPSNKIEVIKHTRHRYKEAAEGTVVLYLDYNFKIEP